MVVTDYGIATSVVTSLKICLPVGQENPLRRPSSYANCEMMEQEAFTTRMHCAEFAATQRVQSHRTKIRRSGRKGSVKTAMHV